MPSLSVKSSRCELSVLTALAQTYGQALLEGTRFALLLDCIADWGAIALVQRVLWSDRPADRPLTALLVDARASFEDLRCTCPEVFMAQAQVALYRRNRRPPLCSEDEGEEGDDP